MRSGRCRIDRRAVVHVFAFKAEEQFVALGLADQPCAGRRDATDAGGGGGGWRMRAQPVGVVAAGAMAGHVNVVLDHEGQAAQGAIAGGCNFKGFVVAQTVPGIMHGDASWPPTALGLLTSHFSLYRISTWPTPMLRSN